MQSKSEKWQNEPFAKKSTSINLKYIMYEALTIPNTIASKLPIISSSVTSLFAIGIAFFRAGRVGNTPILAPLALTIMD